MDPNGKVYVAGHHGLVGSAIVRRLQADGYRDVVTASRKELDLTDQKQVQAFFRTERPRYVFLAAAKVGGILANDTYPAEFIYENLMIEANVIHAAYQAGVERLLFLGSTCIYPKLAPQPLKEEYLLTGPLEPTNEWYAVAKIAGIKLCQAYWRQYGCRYFAVMPTNLYGQGDNFDLQGSHVLPAMIRKFHEAKERGDECVTLWGTGAPRREFLHVDDCADACLFLMDCHEGSDIVNVGVGQDIAISELGELVRKVVGFDGSIAYDRSKPDGTPRKLVDVGRLNAMGWRARISLEDGIRNTYAWYLEHRDALRGSGTTEQTTH